MTSSDLRRAFGAFTTGVVIVGARDGEGSLVGMTANSFTSVSLAPPLALFCPAKSLSAFGAYYSARYFSVNVLDAAQRELSERFARPGNAKWSAVAHELGANGTPLIPSALAQFECEVVQRVEAGDHAVILGRVLLARCAEHGEPLAFFRSRYRGLDSQVPAGHTDEQLWQLGWGL